MKRLLATLLALLLFALPALGEPMSWLDYTDDILADGSPIYYFRELSLTLPSSWRGRVMAMAEEGRTAFYQTASYERYRDEGIEGGGFLFALGASVNGSFSQLPAFRYLGFSEESSLNYYLELPSDYTAYSDEIVRAEYDVMASQIDAVAAGVSFYSDARASVGQTEPEQGEAEAGPPAQEPSASAAQEGGVSLERARNHFEHSALPRYFYDDPANMLAVLEERGTFAMWQSLADENGVAYPYREEDYAQIRYDLSDGAEILQILMPAPEATPLCYRVYMVYNPGTGSAGYYTVEYDNLLGESAFLCGWTKEREHMNYGGAAVLDPASSGYAEALRDEALRVAALAGASTDIAAPEVTEAPENTAGLVEIPCPELGFSTMADPAYSWDYREGTGITIYTEAAGRIPYVIVWQSEDLIAEPFEYIREQYTPHIQAQYGGDLVSCEEVEAYDFGVKRLPAGVYTYRVQDTLVDMIRAYDSTGARTVAYTMKAVHGQTEPTMAALRDAMRGFRAQ